MINFVLFIFHTYRIDFMVTLYNLLIFLYLISYSLISNFLLSDGYRFQWYLNCCVLGTFVLCVYPFRWQADG